MSQNVWCKFFNNHKYEVIKEELLYDIRHTIIGKLIISRCTNCGKIHIEKILTEE